MPRIHPSAVIDPRAELAADVTVGPFCVVGPHVRIGIGCRIDSHVVIEGHTTLGQYNHVFSHVTLGQEPQDLKYSGERTTLEIGDHNDIREHVTMHVGTENGGGRTLVGSHNLIMCGAHVAHDSSIANHCVLANNAMLAGHIVVQDYAVVGGSTGVTQYVTVGRYAYIGGMSGVVRDSPPFMICDGHPARVRGVNMIGLARHRFEPHQIERLRVAYRRLFKRENGSWTEALASLTEEYPDDPNVMELCRFVRDMSKSTNGRHAELLRQDNKRVTPPR